MPKKKYTKKQMKIARVAEPRDEITGADFEVLRKADGGMVRYEKGGDHHRPQEWTLGSKPRVVAVKPRATLLLSDGTSCLVYWSARPTLSCVVSYPMRPKLKPAPLPFLLVK